MPIIITTSKKLKTFPQLLQALKLMYSTVTLKPEQVIEINELQSEFDKKKEAMVVKYMRKELDLYNKYYGESANKDK